jgi:hypothetical protein
MNNRSIACVGIDSLHLVHLEVSHPYWLRELDFRGFSELHVDVPCKDPFSGPLNLLESLSNPRVAERLTCLELYFFGNQGSEIATSTMKESQNNNHVSELAKAEI